MTGIIDHERFARTLKARRTARDLTMQAAALEMGVSFWSVYYWEHLERYPISPYYQTACYWMGLRPSAFRTTL